MRVVREPKTQLGKGFGYVGFHEQGSVEKALELHGTTVSATPASSGTSTPRRASAPTATTRVRRAPAAPARRAPALSARPPRAQC